MWDSIASKSSPLLRQLRAAKPQGFKSNAGTSRSMVEVVVRIKQVTDEGREFISMINHCKLFRRDNGYFEVIDVDALGLISDVEHWTSATICSLAYLMG